jgi:predicted nucleic acid-binding protein
VRVILDTNVFVSGVFFSGPPYRILEAWRDGKLQLVASQEILEEYQRIGEILAEQFPGVNLQPIIDPVTTMHFRI